MPLSLHKSYELFWHYGLMCVDSVCHVAVHTCPITWVQLAVDV